MKEPRLEVIRDDIDRPSLEDWLAEVALLPSVPGISGAETIREVRRELEAEIDEWLDSRLTRRR